MRYLVRHKTVEVDKEVVRKLAEESRTITQQMPAVQLDKLVEQTKKTRASE